MGLSVRTDRTVTDLPWFSKVLGFFHITCPFNLIHLEVRNLNCCLYFVKLDFLS